MTKASAATGQESPNPFVFLLGSPRSGTTLLKRMVNAHPAIAITRETHWITRFYQRGQGIAPDGSVEPELIPLLFEYHRFPQMKSKQERLEAILQEQSPLSYARFVSCIFDRYGERKGKQLVGDKTPNYVRFIYLLHELWPKARFVHIVRDGRDVCLSMAKWRMVHAAAGSFDTWQDDPVLTTAFWWKALVQLGREDGAKLGAELYRELPYHALVEHPEAECRSLCSFLGVAYDEAMLHYNQGKRVEQGGLSANAAWLPPTTGLRDWRDQMPVGDVELFEAAAGDLLEALGLERHHATPSAEACARAARVREAFSDQALKRKWRLPRLW